MALSRTDLGMVDSLAAGVTIRRLVPFPGFMRFLRPLVLLPVWLILTAAASPSPSDASPSPAASPTPQPSPSASPSPSPIAVNAFLSLDVTAGPPATVINVTGGQFLPNQQMALYWDGPAHAAGNATADANGSFNTRVKPFNGDAPGVHKLCANVEPKPCANFTLQSATPTPSASASPTDQPSPSPTDEATPTPQAATPARVNATLSGFDVISKPPFVFLPLFGIGALLLALAYWAFSVLRRPRRLTPLPSAAVVHRATRPDYTAAFGAAPARPADPPAASAWSESMPHGGVQAPPSARPAEPTAPSAESMPYGGAQAPPPAPSAAPPAPSAPGPAVEEPPPPHVEWGLGTPDSGYPTPPPTNRRPDDDWPEMPQPGD